MLGIGTFESDLGGDFPGGLVLQAEDAPQLKIEAG